LSVNLEARLVDITSLTVDAIVNAANNALAPGGGVCGAIHRAAGAELAKACAKVAPCPTGDARITPGFLLPARFVIHAVGPIWRGGELREAELLASAYRRSLELARDHELATIAFPAISTGIYGYPLRDATQIAVATVKGFECSTSIQHVIFACFSDETLRTYAAEGVRAA
jgi:O-acetyl-ADP-ribose deacetylase (regulator of RNase III)